MVKMGPSAQLRPSLAIARGGGSRAVAHARLGTVRQTARAHNSADLGTGFSAPAVGKIRYIPEYGM